MATASKTTASRTGPNKTAAQAKPAAKSKAPPATRRDQGSAPPAPDNDLQARFEAAAAQAKSTRRRPDNATLLKLYSYYKQASAGDVTGDRPGALDFVGGAKYDAWARLKGMSRADAMQNYIKQVERLNRE